MSTGSAISVDVSGWKRQVQWLSLNWGIEARFVMYEVMRLFVKGIQNRLPAARKGGGRGFGANGSNEQFGPASSMSYKGPIQKDLSRIFVPISTMSNLSEELVMHGEKVRILTYSGLRGGHGRKNGAKYGAAWLVDRNLYDPTGSKMAEHHLRNRDRRGRVTQAGTHDKTIGRWKAIDKLHVPAAVFKRYLAEVLTRVGKTKAGMTAGVRLFSRLSNAAASVPSFISRHGEQYGTATNGMTQDGGGYLEARSHIPWSSRFEGLAAFEARLREKDLSHNFDKRMLRLKARWEAMKAA